MKELLSSIQHRGYGQVFLQDGRYPILYDKSNVIYKEKRPIINDLGKFPPPTFYVFLFNYFLLARIATTIPIISSCYYSSPWLTSKRKFLVQVREF